MRVGWLMSDPGYVGGAEMTQAEFRADAPDDVEIVVMEEGQVDEADVYVAHNIPWHTLDEVRATRGRPLIKYVNDAWPISHPGVREWVIQNAALIFCSELHVRKFPHPMAQTDGWVIPPPINLSAFRPSRQHRRNGKREGTCSIAQWRNPGKGAHLIDEWAAANEPVDVYGPGPFLPTQNYCGELPSNKVAEVLWQYERFVFLPTDFEPFCRLIAEAHAAGCEVITNRLVGAAEYLDKPEAIENASERFWDLVTSSARETVLDSGRGK